ncbi:SERTA domain-containing protein 2-like isoform X1 [Centruroides vittatus]|nr:uncharacterized protein LOC111632109 isoform X2 [Centruroides sculpturatus]XP_023232248.1 uncharacterized protein LOC111632109 isoform X2 [Centruroides sculpturatus]XP_023232249.1 uncharacterized protein LOC111632109 isoform X2 [Centruroides sculpturatus]
MLCDPQMRGIKRKFDQDEDSEAETQENHPTVQRQSIFNISVCKLNRFRQMPDPDLLRSVLIRNTIRCIEKEMEKDGVKFTYGPSSSLFLPPISLNSPLGMLNGVPEGGGSQGTVSVTHDCNAYNKCTSSLILPSVMSMSMVTENNYNSNNSNPYCSDYDRYLVNVDSSSGRMTPFVRTLYDRVDSGASWNEEGDRLTSLNWSSVLNFNSSANNVINNGSGVTYNGTQTSENQFDTGHNGCFSGDPILNQETLHTLTPLPTTAISVNAQNQSANPISVPVSGSTSPTSGSLSSSGNSEDEIFGDIDLSLYDFDLLSPLSPPSVKMAPVSAEELMRSLSSNTSDSIQSCQTGNYYKSDYFSEEREHVTPVMS